MPATKRVSAKRKCCKDKPRCKSCPVTLKRLSDAGYAERLDLRTYEVMKDIPKQAKKDARVR